MYTTDKGGGGSRRREERKIERDVEDSANQGVCGGLISLRRSTIVGFGKTSKTGKQSLDKRMKGAERSKKTNYHIT